MSHPICLTASATLHPMHSAVPARDISSPLPANAANGYASPNQLSRPNSARRTPAQGVDSTGGSLRNKKFIFTLKGVVELQSCIPLRASTGGASPIAKVWSVWPTVKVSF
ncbi:hypothetical protein QQF64_005796 [Cirrhinus molitorella]|uniref:Uncharacterized protein n=2 Tax=Cirrhinus molitorella TaxID=172907 RepID=A0AA88PU75_9TELE|nr:hypothetical protein Q8A67_011160 [Cirrhinus molitorella]